MENDIPFKRKIRSFVRRGGRLTASQKRALEEFWPQYGIEFNNEPLNLDHIFNRTASKNIEIGFGMAENLIAVAKSQPNKDFIGIEVHEPGIGNALNQIEEYSLSNLRVIKHDAVEVLKHQIAEHSIDSISIFFPDPWHKKKHHKRRLINSEFVDLLARKIKKGGHVFMATDWENYAEQMLEVFANNPKFENLSEDNTYCDRIEFRSLTKFERRGQRLGHGVWDLIFRRI